MSTTELRTKFAGRLASVAPGLLERTPVMAYVSAFDEQPGFGGYGRVPPAANAINEAIVRDHGEPVLEDYHRLVLLELIDRFDERAARIGYPSEVRSCFEGYLRGIVAQMDKNPGHFYRNDNDAFAKDFAVCRHKLVPCGAQLVDVRSGVPRSIALRGGGMQAARFLRFMLLRAGGFRTFYEMHMDPRLILEFNPKGWTRCYLRIARMLEAHPRIRGVCGSSWWFDPAVESVSPRLAFLRGLPAEGRAAFFRVGESEASTGDALTNSRERRQAYDAGRYRPVSYAMVWARDDLVAWAQAHSP